MTVSGPRLVPEKASERLVPADEGGRTDLKEQQTQPLRSEGAVVMWERCKGLSSLGGLTGKGRGGVGVRGGRGLAAGGLRALLRRVDLSSWVGSGSQHRMVCRV